MRPLSLAVLLVATGACAQSTPEPAPGPLAPAPAAADLSEAEEAVQAIIAEDGVHVVRFWAPWCHNSMNELRGGLYETIEAHPEATFTFVAVRNGGEDGAATLERFAIPEHVRVLAHPDEDPLLFLGRPISWTPTTWVFNRNGDLAYAFNYGEVTDAMLAQAIADAGADWSH